MKTKLVFLLLSIILSSSYSFAEDKLVNYFELRPLINNDYEKDLSVSFEHTTADFLVFETNDVLETLRGFYLLFPKHDPSAEKSCELGNESGNYSCRIQIDFKANPEKEQKFITRMYTSTGRNPTYTTTIKFNKRLILDVRKDN